MSLDEFLYILHFDTEKARPTDLEVDWDDAPLPYKLYRGVPDLPLSSELPLSLEGLEQSTAPNLKRIGDLLWYVYGLTQISQSVLAADSAEQTVGTMQSNRRFVPSGGALYPNELYVYLKCNDAPLGVYHYDVAHHRLELLREGNFDSYLARSLGERCDLHSCFGAVFVSTYFWKNFYKYNNFAYRLQGLDAGVLIGQLLEVAKRFGFASTVYFQFLDRAINHLIGLSQHQESVYAVIPLSVEPCSSFLSKGNEPAPILSSDELCRELAQVQHEQYVRSQRVLEYPLLIKMNEASMQESFQTCRQETTKIAGVVGQEVALPQQKRLSFDLASVCRKRYSPELDFVLQTISQTQLATLLQETTASFSYRNDVDDVTEPAEMRVSLYCCLYNVEGIPDGAYHYDEAVHVLRQVRPGDQRISLQRAMSLDNVNLFQVPICIHVVGERDHLKRSLGYRGYRIQQMEAGMLVQRLLLVASALGLGGHPLLGFDVDMTDDIYNLAPQGKTCLIQIPVGPHHCRPRLQGGLQG